MIVLNSHQSWQLHYAAHVIREGGIIAYPTEAVWGLGCDPWNRTAVEKLLWLKSRPVHKGMILISGNERHFAPLTQGLDEKSMNTLKTSWPGPNTWVIEDTNDWVPEWIKGRFSSVAVRQTDHALVARLCETLGHPIVSTSANPSGFSLRDQYLEFASISIKIWILFYLGNWVSRPNPLPFAC